MGRDEQDYNYDTGNPEDDALTRKLINVLVSSFYSILFLSFSFSLSLLSLFSFLIFLEPSLSPSKGAVVAPVFRGKLWQFKDASVV